MPATEKAPINGAPTIQSTDRIEVEHTAERDLIVPRFDVLIIVGSSGLYKTTAAEMITGTNSDPRNAEAQARYHIDGIRKPYKVGELVRAEIEARTGQPFIEKFEVDVEDDRRIDEEARQIIENSRKPRLIITNEGLISELRPAAILIEGRFQGFIGADVEKQMAGRKYAPKIERAIFYSSDDNERRGIEVARELAKGNTSLSEAELAELSNAREISLSEKAQHLFPELVMGQYIFDPQMKTPDGRDVFTIKIDAKGKNPEQLTEELHRKLIERNSLLALRRENFADTPEGESAFKLIKSLQRCQGLLEGNSCNRYGIRTVDVYQDQDLLAQIAACSSDHALNVQTRILREADEGYTFSKNGITVN